MESLMQQWLMLQKKALDNSFKSMTELQDYVAQQVLSCVEMNPVLPEEGKKLIVEWAQTYRRGRDDLKDRVDENYKKAEAFFSKEHK